MFECETEMRRVEGDRSQHVGHLVTDAVETQGQRAIVIRHWRCAEAYANRNSRAIGIANVDHTHPDIERFVDALRRLSCLDDLEPWGSVRPGHRQDFPFSDFMLSGDGDLRTLLDTGAASPVQLRSTKAGQHNELKRIHAVGAFHHSVPSQAPRLW